MVQNIDVKLECDILDDIALIQIDIKKIYGNFEQHWIQFRGPIHAHI